MMKICLSFVAALLVATPLHAAPVIAAFTAVGGFFTATFGAALGGMLFRVSLSLVVSELSKLFQKKQRSPGIVTKHTTSGEAEPASFPLGWYATGGHHACPPYTHGSAGDTPNAFLTYVITVSDLPGVKLKRIFVDDTIAELGDEVHPEYGTEIKIGSESLTGFAWVKWLDGYQTQADPMLLEKFGDHPHRPWLPDMIGHGLTVGIVTFKYKRSLFNSLPRLKFEVQGIPLYDPRKDSSVGGSGNHRFDAPETWEETDNPQVMNYNIARGIALPDGSVWGGGIAMEDLPLSSWFAGMNACDVPVEGDDGEMMPTYRAGFEVRLDEEPADIMDELNKASSAQIAEVGGVFKVRVGSVNIPVAWITDGDIVVTEDGDYVPFPATEETYNAVHANYPDPGLLWNSKDAPARYNEEYEAEDQGRRRSGSLTLGAAPYPAQVQFLMDGWVKDARRFRRHNLVLPPSYAHLEPLDAVAWNSSVHGYDNNKLFEVGSVVDNLQTCNQGVAIRERDAADYDPSQFELIGIDQISAVPDIPGAQEVTGFAVSAASVISAGGVTRSPAIKIEWQGVTQDDISAIRYQVKKNDALVCEGFVPGVEAGEFLVTERIHSPETYSVRAVFVLDTDRATNWSDWVEVDTEIVAPVKPFIDSVVVKPSGPERIVYAEVALTHPEVSEVAFFEIDLLQNGIRLDRQSLVVPGTARLRLPPQGYGAYQISAKAVGYNGRPSLITLASVEYSPLDVRPPKVENFRIRVSDRSAQLSWSPAGDLASHYVIRFIPAGVEGTWHNAMDVEPEFHGTVANVPVLPGIYLIKAVSVFGVFSAEPTSIHTNYARLAGLNVVKVESIHPEFSGNLGLGLHRNGAEIQLLSASGDEALAVEASATFVSDVVTDLGAVMTCQVSAYIRAWSYDLDFAWSDWGVWSDVESWAGDVDGKWRVKLQINTTEQDPTDPNSSWAGWVDYAVGDYVARGFKYRVVFQSYHPTVSVVLDRLQVEIDVPDRTVEGVDIECPAEGVFVEFSGGFWERPAIAVDGQGLPLQAKSERTQVTNLGFHQRFIDENGNGIACSFDYIAKGYGVLK